MTLDQVEYAKNKPWFVEAGCPIPSCDDDCYGVRVQLQEPNTYDRSIMMTRTDVFFDYDAMIKWEAEVFNNECKKVSN